MKLIKQDLDNMVSTIEMTFYEQSLIRDILISVIQEFDELDHELLNHGSDEIKELLKSMLNL